MRLIIVLFISFCSLFSYADTGHYVTVVRGSHSFADSFYLPNRKVDTTATALLGHSATGAVVTSPCGCILHVRDSISSSQILNSYTSPVTLIAAPGAGYFIHVINISSYYMYSTAYVSSNLSGLFMGDTLHASTAIDITDPTSNQFILNLPLSNVQSITFANKPLTFYTQTANPTTGHGYFIFYIDYIIEQY